MRSLLAVAAAAWFIVQAVSFLPAPFAYVNDGQVGGIDGDGGAVAVTWAARALFAGLALIALALVEWGVLYRLMRTSSRDG